MDTYTLGMTPRELIGKRVRSLPDGKFSLQLTPADLITVTDALGAYGLGQRDPDASQENAISLRCGILETLGIEEV